MKFRFIYLLLFGALFSCSSDDDSTNNSCELEVYGMNFSDGIYTIEYGRNENNTTTVEVDEDTYNYYVGITEDSDPEDCWIGIQ